MNHYDNPDWYPWELVAAGGAAIIALGVVFQLLQIYVSIRDRNLPENRDLTGDAWGTGRTLEWAISSPPPAYNFAVIPKVYGLDTFHIEKEMGRPAHGQALAPIHMPKNTSAGVFIGAFTFIFGFAAVWYIWWLAGLGLLGILVTWILRSANEDIDYYVPVSEVEHDEEVYSRRLAAAQAAE